MNIDESYLMNCVLFQIHSDEEKKEKRKIVPAHVFLAELNGEWGLNEFNELHQIGLSSMAFFWVWMIALLN